jgi:hypothetical protein
MNKVPDPISITSYNMQNIEKVIKFDCVKVNNNEIIIRDPVREELVNAVRQAKREGGLNQARADKILKNLGIKSGQAGSRFIR